MNTLYPGQPDYVGPDQGLACWVHHEHPIEYCTNFAERLAYIRAEKPAHEQAVRLAALTCLPLDRLPADLIQALTAYGQARTALDQARTAYGQARTALDQARTAYDQALTAYGQAGTAYDQAGTAYDQAGTAYDQALTAYDQAWTAYDQALTAYGQAGTAYDQAGTALDQARTAYRPLLLALMNELVPASLWNDQGLIFPQPGGQP